MEYESVVVNLTTRTDSVSLQELQFALQSHEMRIELQSSTISTEMPILHYANAAFRRPFPDSHGSYSGAHGRGAFYSHSRGRGRGGRRSFGRGNKLVCQLCGRSGHSAVKCYHRFDISFNGVDSNSKHRNFSG